jgi:hypothetical protein
MRLKPRFRLPKLMHGVAGSRLCAARRRLDGLENAFALVSLRTDPRYTALLVKTELSL